MDIVRLPPGKRGRNSVNNGQSSAADTLARDVLLLSTAQLALQVASQTRQLAAAICVTILLPCDSLTSTAAITAGSQYFQQRTAGSTSAALGSPHLHVWKALSNSLTQVPNADVNNVQVIRKYLNLDFEILSQIVQFCRANTTFDKKSVKITLIIAPEHLVLKKL